MLMLIVLQRYEVYGLADAANVLGATRVRESSSLHLAHLRTGLSDVPDSLFRSRSVRIVYWHAYDMSPWCSVAARDSGKPMVDAAFGELMVTCEKALWLVDHGEQYLKPERRRPGRMVRSLLTRSSSSLGRGQSCVAGSGQMAGMCVTWHRALSFRVWGNLRCASLSGMCVDRLPYHSVG